MLSLSYYRRKEKEKTPYGTEKIPGNEVLSAVADGVPVLLMERKRPALYLLEQPGLMAVAIAAEHSVIVAKFPFHSIPGTRRRRRRPRKNKRE